jgi:hypothetical protein
VATSQYLVIGIPVGAVSAQAVPDAVRRLIWNAGVGSTITVDLGSSQLERALADRGSLRKIG